MIRRIRRYFAGNPGSSRWMSAVVFLVALVVALAWEVCCG